MKELQLTTFRGKKYNGEWITGNYYFNKLLNAHMILATEGTKICPTEVHFDTVTIRVDGIHDKNGNDVFVGDILEITFPRDTNMYLGKVIYFDGEFLIKCTDGGMLNLFFDAENTVVIGNVYDNPELLEV